jgi:pyrroline-5-carboxylate reductase
VLERIKGAINDKTVIVSMAAGVTVEKIASVLGGTQKIIRIMPNTPVACCEGVIIYSLSETVTEENENAFLNILKEAGSLYRLPEEKIDAGCALSGCGPAFVFKFIEAMTAGGRDLGLTKEEAQAFAAKTVLGAARLLTESGCEPEQLREAVCSPGGATIEGVRSLDENGFDKTVKDAIRASFNKTKALMK